MQHFFLYLTISSLFLFTGCIQRTIEYNTQPQSNFYDNETETVTEVKSLNRYFKPIKVKGFSQKKGKAETMISEFYKKPVKVCKPRYIIKYRTYPKPNQDNPFNYQAPKNSTFEKILEINKNKKVKIVNKVKANNNEEEFPSNVPISFK